MAQDRTEPSFYALGDDDLSAQATAAPLRSSSMAGRYEVAGRLRVAAILKQAGLASTETPERIAGSTNEVWRVGDYVVRVGFIPGADRLRREAYLSRHLPPVVQYPKVLAAGSETFGEWMVLKRRPGITLSHAWGSMDERTRKSTLQDIAEALKAIHALRFTGDDVQRFAFHEGEGPLALPHQLPAQRLLDTLAQLHSRPDLDKGLLADAEERVRLSLNVFDSLDSYGLVHGDLHFENILVKDEVVIAMFDFEWSRNGPPEVDLDVLARFCAHPQLHVGGDYKVDPMDYRNVMSWLCEFYPEPFEHPLFLQRMMLCALAFEIPSLAAAPVRTSAAELSRFHPINRMRELLDDGPHILRLGWQSPW